MTHYIVSKNKLTFQQNHDSFIVGRIVWFVSPAPALVPPPHTLTPGSLRYCLFEQFQGDHWENDGLSFPTAYKSPFLARLQGAYAITWRPSSVSMARFVTAGAIDLKLCTYVPLGKRNSQDKFQPSQILCLASRGPKLNSWTNGWIISKFLS
jgi:hypothetical protein